MDENNNFIYGVITGIVACIVSLFVIFILKTAMQGDVEDRKTEHLTITYKNSKQLITDKEMLVDILKQHFPSSNWEHVDSKASENYLMLDVYNINKQ